MKRSDRQGWIDVDNHRILCSWCRYANWGDEECYCGHPESLRLELRYSPTGIEPGDDCWGFRPHKGDTPAAARLRVQEVAK